MKVSCISVSAGVWTSSSTRRRGHGVLEVLTWLHDMWFKNVVFESDSKAIVYAFHGFTGFI